MGSFESAFEDVEDNAATIHKVLHWGTNDGEFAEIRTVGIEGVSRRNFFLDTIQAHREDTRRFSRRVPCGGSRLERGWTSARRLRSHGWSRSGDHSTGDNRKYLHSLRIVLQAGSMSGDVTRQLSFDRPTIDLPLQRADHRPSAGFVIDPYSSSVKARHPGSTRSHDSGCFRQSTSQ